jgi:hypothetical protein
MAALFVLSVRAATAVKAWQEIQDRERWQAGSAWHDLELVFCREDPGPAANRSASR